MRYFRKPDGWFDDSGCSIAIKDNKGKYLWCIGPDYSYALYKSGEVGEAHLTDIEFGQEPFVYRMTETEWAERNLKNGLWIEVNREGNTL